MNSAIVFVSRLIRKPAPLLLKDFTEIRYESDLIPKPNHYFPNNKLGGVWLQYFNKNHKSIAYIRYYTSNGQIGVFSIHNEYQNRGLGTQILEKATNELRDKNCKEVWAVSSEFHTFWYNVNNKSFTYSNPVHPSSNEGGYIRKL